MDKPVACEYCGRVLKNRASYRTHKSNFHRNEKPPAQLFQNTAVNNIVTDKSQTWSTHAARAKTDNEFVNDYLDKNKHTYEKEEWNTLKRKANDKVTDGVQKIRKIFQDFQDGKVNQRPEETVHDHLADQVTDFQDVKVNQSPEETIHDRLNDQVTDFQDGKVNQRPEEIVHDHLADQGTDFQDVKVNQSPEETIHDRLNDQVTDFQDGKVDQRPEDITYDHLADQVAASNKKHRLRRHKFCKCCGKGFVRTHDLRLHVSEKHPFCGYCNKQFSTKPTFEKHTHSFQCPVCGNCYDKPEYAYVHIKIHPQCPECEARFLTKTQLIRHRRRKHSKYLDSQPDVTVSISNFRTDVIDQEDSTETNENVNNSKEEIGLDHEYEEGYDRDSSTSEKDSERVVTESEEENDRDGPISEEDSETVVTESEEEVSNDEAVNNSEQKDDIQDFVDRYFNRG